MKKIDKEYEAHLIAKDGFEKVINIREPMLEIYIPERSQINVFLEQPNVYDVNNERRLFKLNKDKSYKKKLVYEEI
jgi:hypothetical protein